MERLFYKYDSSFFWSGAALGIIVVFLSNYSLSTSDLIKYLLPMFLACVVALNTRQKCPPLQGMAAAFILASLFSLNLWEAFSSSSDSFYIKLFIKKDFYDTDFCHYFFGAESSYSLGRDPYSWFVSSGENIYNTESCVRFPSAFPFPTYYFTDLLVSGSFSDFAGSCYKAFWTLLLLTLASFYLITRSTPYNIYRSRIANFFLSISLLWNIEIVFSIAYLQYSILCLFLVVLGLYLWICCDTKITASLSGLTVTLAVFIKPHLLFFWLFFIVSMLLYCMRKYLRKEVKIEARGAIVGFWVIAFTAIPARVKVVVT